MNYSGFPDVLDLFATIIILFLLKKNMLTHFSTKFVQKSGLYKISLNNSELQCGFLVDGLDL